MKRTPVRLINARTAGSDTGARTGFENNPGMVAVPEEQAVKTGYMPQTLVPELKRIGILFAVILFLLVVLSLIF